MRFQGLPPELHIGCVDLNIVPPCTLLETCICLSCNRASPSYLICSAEHVICPACCIPCLSTQFAWCPICQRRVPVRSESVPQRTVNAWRFQCTCGIEGNLASLREHLLDENSSHEIKDTPSNGPRSGPLAASDQQDSSHDEACRNVEKFKDINRSLTDGTAIAISELRQQLSLLEQDLLKRLDEVSERVTTIDNNRVMDTSEIRKLLKIEKETHSRDNILLATRIINQIATSSRAYFWFEFEKFYKKYAESATTTLSDWQYKVTAAICFGVMIRLEKVNGIDYVGVLASPKNKIKTGFPWPVTRRVTISIHDKNGCAIMRKFFDFIYQDPQALDGGFVHFLDVASIQTKQCLLQGKLCISLEIGATG